ncbi:SH2 domain-containing adapter protein F-like [Scyliorhinus canicula]|uniref:SH2 domain-containing adapter protein F-like n=1 Tax=Scyliorhinus canicula TaxID=7830 RepID=UPI0018F4904D|nr:SH2 domain-containing adapter protein F-like [Scyliorhinus canicula]
MAKWFKEHLGFRSSKGPPQPPKPDYRPRAAGEPDILTAYKLQKERDFEDPYSGYRGLRSSPGQAATATAPGAPSTGSSPHPHPAQKAASPHVKYISPKHRLIKVENPEKSSSKSPTSPEDNSQGKVIILEDYADPFDAKQAGVVPVGPEKVTGNDGYMEPYEAQKMMAAVGMPPAFELRPSNSALGRRTAESRLATVKTPNNISRLKRWTLHFPPPGMSFHLTNSRDLSPPPVLAFPRPCATPPPSPPSDQQTPPKAWDCQSSRIVPESPAIGDQQSVQRAALETNQQHVQFDGVDKNRVSPPKEETVRHQNRLSGPSVKSVKHQSLEFSGVLGERVEPSLSLGRQTWYHGAISRTDAENLLRLCKEASYLVRNSETTKNDYSLSLKSNQGFMHMKLTRTKESKYVLGLNSPPFDSVPEIIHYYGSRKLPIKGAEHMSLLYPVAIRTL